MRWLKHIGFVIGLVALAGAGCSSPSVSVSSTANGPPLPPELTKAVHGNLCVSLSVHVYLNNVKEGEVEKIKVSADGSTLTDFQVSLPVGTHSLYLEYLISDPSYRPEPIKVARTTTLHDVVISVEAPTINFSSATIAQLFDDDADGVSNVKEWQDETLPCVPPPATEFSVNVRVSGLQGTLVLSNGREDLSVTNNGNFAFPTQLPNGTGYNVTVETPPANQTCTVGAGAQGTIEGSHVFGIDVSCGLPLYTVFVTVAGLQGNGLVLQNNGRDDLLVTATGQVRFAAQLVTGQRYGVSVHTQPSKPGEPVERCIVVNSSGVVQQADISTVGVECTVLRSPNYTIGGVVNGLKGQVVLRRGRDDLIVTQSGPFSFALPLASAASYDVSIVQQPSAQACTLSNATGEVAAANIDNIVVTCNDALALDANPLNREVELTWNGNDAAAYSLYVSTASNCDLADYTICPGGQLIPNVVSPFRLTGLDNDQIHYFRLEAHYPGVNAMLSQEVRARPGVLHPNGPVLDMQVAGDGTMYLAGEFSRFVVPITGGATLDVGSGRANSAFTVEGHVKAVIPDGTGGWYIGGAFSHVNGVARQNLAHLWADDSLDSAFDVPVTGEAVYALVLNGNRLYVGGTFTTVGVEERPYLAAIDLDTKSVTGWTPAPNGKVNALAAQGRRVFVGGEFNEIGEATQRVGDHAPVAAFDDSGALLAWNPPIKMSDSTAPTVRSIAAGEGRIYVAGTFDTLGSEKVGPVAGFLDNDTLDQSWLSAVNDWGKATVTQLVFGGSWLYILSYPDYQYPYHNGFIRNLDPANGKILKTIVTPPNLNPKVLAANATTLFIGNANESWVVPSIVAIDVASGGQVVWEREPPWNFGINTLALDDDGLFVGSHAQMHWNDRGVERNNVAALSKAGQLLEWKPRPNGSVTKLAVTDGAVYMLGEFDTVSGEERSRVAAVDHTGRVLGWHPGKLGSIPFWEIRDMIAVNDTVYFGGEFGEFAGSIRTYAAAIDANGSLTDWAPAPNGAVFVLADGGNGAIFLGGEFTEVGGAAHGNLAAVDAHGVGAVDHSWVVNADYPVISLLRSGPDTLYVGGAFSTLNGKAGTGPIAVVSVGGTVHDPVNPAGLGITGLVNKMTLSGGALLAEGCFNAADGRCGQTLVALGSSILDVLTWNPTLDDNRVTAIEAHPTNGTVYLGGHFQNVGGRLQPYLAEVATPTQ